MADMEGRLTILLLNSASADNMRHSSEECEDHLKSRQIQLIHVLSSFSANYVLPCTVIFLKSTHYANFQVHNFSLGHC